MLGKDEGMTIKVDDLTGSEIAAFLEEHVQDMRAVSPPESKHALDLEGLRQPEITFWTAREEGGLLGCCALKMLNEDEAEVKSMRVAPEVRGKGVGDALVQHLITEGRRRCCQRLLLETGAMAFFAPARRLYERHGFLYCGPFGSYKEDVNSVFMVLG